MKQFKFKYARRTAPKIQIETGGVYVGLAADFFEENSIFPKKKSLHRRFYDRNLKDFSKIWWGDERSARPVGEIARRESNEQGSTPSESDGGRPLRSVVGSGGGVYFPVHKDGKNTFLTS